MSDLHHLHTELEQHLAMIRDREQIVEDVTAQARNLAESGAITATEEQQLNESLAGLLDMLQRDRAVLRAFRVQLVDALAARRSLDEKLIEAKEDIAAGDWWKHGGEEPSYSQDDED